MYRHLWEPLTVAALMAGSLLTGCSRAAKPPAPPVPEVAVVTVRPQRGVLASELPGRTCAYRVAEIRPQVNGLIQKRLFTEGSHVKSGEILYQIDPAPYQAALDNATANVLSARKGAERARATLNATIAGLRRYEATLALAKTNLQRNESLLKTHAVSAMDRDQSATDADVADATLRTGEAQVVSDRAAVGAAEAAIQQAEAELETARINLRYTTITAPISGRVGRSNVTEGAIVTAYQTVPLATIQQFDPIYVDVPQSTVVLTRLRRNLADGHLKDNGTDRVKIVLEDGTAYPQEGSLKFRDVSVDPTTGSVILRVVVPNPDGTLLPGMFVQATIEEGVRDQAILVPQQAVSRDPKGNPLTLIVDAAGKVQQRGLSTERAMGDEWLISSGLARGDRVIVEGMQKVRPGMLVKAVPFEASGTIAAKPDGAVRTADQSNLK